MRLQIKFMTALLQIFYKKDFFKSLTGFATLCFKYGKWLREISYHSFMQLATHGMLVEPFISGVV